MAPNCSICRNRRNIFSLLTHAPIHMFQTVFACMLVPYLIIHLDIFYDGVATVIATGAFSHLLIQVLAQKCRLFSILEEVTPGCLKIMVVVIFLFWTAAIVGLATIPILIHVEIVNYVLYRTVFASICYGLIQLAISSLSKSLEYFHIEKQESGAKKIKGGISDKNNTKKTKTKTKMMLFLIPMFGIVLGIAVLQVVSRFMPGINFIFAGTLAPIAFFLAIGMVVSAAWESKDEDDTENKPDSAKKATTKKKAKIIVDFCDPWLYPVCLFVLLFAMSFGSFTYLATDWYMRYTSSSSNSTTLASQDLLSLMRDPVDLFSCLSGAQAISLFMAVLLYFCLARKGKNILIINIRLRAWTTLTILLAVAAFLLMAYYPLGDPWTVILLPFLGFYRLTDPVSRYIFAAMKQSQIIYDVVHYLGLIMGIIMSSAIILNSGYPLLLKIDSGLASVALLLYVSSLIYVYWNERQSWKKFKT